MENELRQPVNVPIVTKPVADKPKDVKVGRASDEYKNGMLTALRTNFRQVSNVLQEGVDADGGYLVPEEYDSRLIDVLEEENIMRKLAHRITTSGEHKINIAATKPAAAWIEEGGALQWGDATFDQILLDAHKLHVAIKITEELLYDNAFRLENYIIEQFGKALANAEEDAFLNGSGVGQPLGLFAEKGGGNEHRFAAEAGRIRPVTGAAWKFDCRSADREMRCFAEGNFPCREKGIRPAGDFAADTREKGAFSCPAQAGRAGEPSRRKDGAGSGSRIFCRFAGKELCKSDRI